MVVRQGVSEFGCWLEVLLKNLKAAKKGIEISKNGLTNGLYLCYYIIRKLNIRNEKQKTKTLTTERRSKMRYYIVGFYKDGKLICTSYIDVWNDIDVEVGLYSWKVDNLQCILEQTDSDYYKIIDEVENITE